jgi:hypothetical protein
MRIKIKALTGKALMRWIGERIRKYETANYNISVKARNKKEAFERAWKKLQAMPRQELYLTRQRMSVVDKKES